MTFDPDTALRDYDRVKEELEEMQQAVNTAHRHAQDSNLDGVTQALDPYVEK